MRVVVYDIFVFEYVVGVKVLGLISRYIIGFFWSFLENKLIYILEMNENYL